MDLPVHWTLELLKDVLPPETLSFLQTHLLHLSSSPLLSHGLAALRARLSALPAQMAPLLTAALDRLLALVSDSSSSNVVAAALVLVLAALLLQVLALLRRLLLFATRLALRAAFWSAAVLLAAAVYQRGLQASARDALALLDALSGWVVGVAEVWWREYERSREGYERYHHHHQAQAQREQGAQYYYQGRGGAGRGGWR
ncbi:hypothetical protein VTK56DRAFT_9619 [Thermocarpiscus australiensis]